MANNAYNLLLNYFDGDYKPISNVAGPDSAVYGALGADSMPLYNGNISSIGVNIKKLNLPLLYGYQYDQLNRLTHMDAWKRTSTAWSALTPTTDYQENVTYDPNGNILTYHRNRETTDSSNQMDQLQYNYISGTNQLDHIYDTVPGTSNAGDIGSQSAGNYKYDSIGELVGDAASNITNITWTVYGKIASITKSTDTVIRYTYDPAGNRISKTVTHAGSSTVTWYVRDAQGNILSVYTYGDPSINGGTLAQTELDIYGSSRLGIWKRVVPVTNLDSTVHSSFSGDSITFTRGNKLFELTNHLGNVLATISDKRYGVTTDDSTVVYYNPEVVSANDYYPFGMMQYARTYTEANVGNYRYRFNGKEQDNEVKGVGDQIDYGMRVYDPRVAKFLSLDPLTAKYPDLTPYQYASNRPIDGIDQDGLEYISTKDANITSSEKNKDGTYSLKIGDQAIKATSIVTHDGTDYYNIGQNLFKTVKGIAKTGKTDQKITTFFVTQDQLKEIFPKGNDLDVLANVLNQSMSAYGIDTYHSLAHLLGQAGPETGEFKKLNASENLNYSTINAICNAYCRGKNPNPDLNDNTPAYLHNPDGIGDEVYEGGHNYHGRGILQLTHLGNYKDFGNDYNKRNETTFDFVKNPDIVLQKSDIAIISGLWYFQTRVINKVNIETATVRKVTELVNGGKNALSGRQTDYNKAIKALRK